MCILFWTVDNHPFYRFIFAANRDEFIERPAKRADFWDPPYEQILAGQDLLGNGTWLGITRNGRFAALTNFRENALPKSKKDVAISRGLIVRDFLSKDNVSVSEFLSDLNLKGKQYDGFIIIACDFKEKPEFWYASNRDEKPRPLESKRVYGLSNTIISQEWPKVKEGKLLFQDILQTKFEDETSLIHALFRLLQTTSPFPNDDFTSNRDSFSTRIKIPLVYETSTNDVKRAYATRSSTVILIDNQWNATFVERHLFDEKGNPENIEFHHKFRISI
ncbi:uncharacterized protein VTP21DRAFT_3054 [Calcarisporiella thermophila]|uniref:uncharacterized protein n=1 Tax=Calcarisporiella thermophila TaxID=911321 RepID=UPI003742A1A3